MERVDSLIEIEKYMTKLTLEEINMLIETGGPLIIEGCDILQQLADVMRENDENCRLLGASGERELALRAENETLRALSLELCKIELGEMTTEKAREKYHILGKLYRFLGYPNLPSWEES